MIKSFLDNDFYKFTMQKAVFNMGVNKPVKYKFINRGDTNDVILESIELINKEIDNLCSLRITDKERIFLGRSLDKDFEESNYISFLKDFRFNRELVNIDTSNNEFKLYIEGDFLSTTLFEVPLLAIISEVSSNYFMNQMGENNINNKLSKIYDDLEFLDNTPVRFSYSDFGTRRRESYKYQKMVIDNYFINTSNVYISMLNKTQPIGTIAHEWYMYYQGLVKPYISQEKALYDWITYSNQRVALTDTLGVDYFIKDIDRNPELLNLYTGFRQDSGCPFEWTDKIFNMLDRYGYQHEDFKYIYSDSLDFKKATKIKIYNPYAVFGIGTYLTNGNKHKPNIVIKMIECDGKPVAKISDSEGKQSCEDMEYVYGLKELISD